MSEYRCYEFVALDRALGPKETAQLQKLSRQAEVSRTHFWTEYHGGVAKLDPIKLLERYFDIALCFTSAPSLRMLLRLPADQVDLGRLKAYFPGGAAVLLASGDHVVIDLHRTLDEDVDGFFARGQLSKLLPLRAALLRADLGAAYLAWLLAVQVGDVNGARKEPPVPLGLRSPAPALSVLSELFEVDADLWSAAAEGSGELELDTATMRRWVRALSEREKERWLLKAMQARFEDAGRELRQAFALSQQPVERRSAAALRARASELAAARDAAATTHESDEPEDKRQRAAHSRRMGALRRQSERAFLRLSRLIAGRQYDEAVRLAAELRDALSDGDASDFQRRLASLRKHHARRHGYLRLGKPQAVEPRGATAE